MTTIKKNDQHSPPKQSKTWSITTPKEAAIVTKVSYGDGAIHEVRKRKRQAVKEADFSRGSFWQKTEELLIENDATIDYGVIEAKIKLERYIEHLFRF